MDVHIDIDGTILDTMSSWKRDVGINYKMNDYNIDAVFYPGALKDYINWIHDGGRPIVYKGALKTIRDLIKKGHNVKITTSRQDAGIEIFKKQFPEFKDIVFSKKWIITNKIGCDVLVDDYPMEQHVHLSQWTYIVDREYNKEIWPDCERIRSLRDITKVIR